MEVSQAGCKKRFSRKTSLTIFLPVLPVGNPSRVSQNLDLRCVLLWRFHLRPLEILLRPVLHDGVCPWVSRYYQFQFPQVYISHQKFTGRISFQCGRFFYRPSGPWMDFLPIVWFSYNMEEQTCKTQVTGLGCSNIMSILLFERPILRFL